MFEQFAQGDLLFERVSDRPSSDEVQRRLAGNSWWVSTNVIARGEKTGHAHVIDIQKATPYEGFFGGVRDINGVVVTEETQVVHDEHDPLTLPVGSYLVRRQREYTPPRNLRERSGTRPVWD